MTVEVLVVIPVANGGRTLENCLLSVANQSFTNISLAVVVDSRSNDNTLEIAEKYCKPLICDGERSRKINYGISLNLKADYLLWIDADMILHPELINELVKYSCKNSFDALYFPEHIFGQSWNSKIRSFERPFFDGTPVDSIRWLNPVAREIIGEWDEKEFKIAGGEEWDIDSKLIGNCKVGLFPRSFECVAPKPWDEMLLKYMNNCGIESPSMVGVYHDDGNLPLKNYLQKKRYYSYGVKNYISKQNMTGRKHLKMLNLKYRYFSVYVENAKWKRIISNPLNMFQVYLLRVMLGVCYLFWKVSPNKIVDPYKLSY